MNRLSAPFPPEQQSRGNRNSNGIDVPGLEDLDEDFELLQ